MARTKRNFTKSADQIRLTFPAKVLTRILTQKKQLKTIIIIIILLIDNNSKNNNNGGFSLAFEDFGRIFDCSFPVALVCFCF